MDDLEHRKTTSDHPQYDQSRLQLGSDYLGQGLLKLEAGDSARGVADLEKAVVFFEQLVEEEKGPDKFPMLAFALNSLAWVCATHHSKELRNGSEAVELATRACELTNWREFNFLDTLAAAYAERGNFDEAVKWQMRAKQLVPEAHLAEKCNSRILLYESRTPYRFDPPADTLRH